MAKWLAAGRIVSTHGLRGEMRVLPQTDTPEFLTQFSELKLDGAVCRASVRVQKTCVLVRLEGVDTLDGARALVGKTLFFDGDAAKLPEGTFFVEDLLGMTALCGGKTVGTVTDVLLLPKHDVYEITGKTTYLVPAVPEFIRKIDPEARTVEITLLEGMEEDAH